MSNYKLLDKNREVLWDLGRVLNLDTKSMIHKRKI